MEEGVFERLDGAGKPLDLCENPFEDPSLRMAHRLLKNNGFAPAWIEEAKEIEQECGRLRNLCGMPPEERRRHIAALNRRILSYNLKAPESAHKQLVSDRA